MWNRILKWLKGPTPEEAYEAGRNCAAEAIKTAKDKSSEADHLYNLAAGGFNTTKAHREFDRGIEDQLHEMGYEAPYQNGNF